MRRTVVWTVGLGVTVALTGMASASLSTSDTLARSPIEVGAEQVGTLEPVRAVLGNLDHTSTLRYPGAPYVKVHFARVALRPGDFLTVSTGDGAEVERLDAGAADGRWAQSVAGDTAVVRLHTSGPGAGVTIDRVARGFTARELAARRTPESICGTDTKHDAVCYRSSDPVVYHSSKAVARLLIEGVELCTAWRIGPQNRLLTNHHCLTTSEQAQQTEVWFNYMCAVCGGYEVFRPTKVRGSEVLSTDERLDYTLFTVDDFAAVERFGYLEPDLRRPEPGEELYVPQHPAGQPTTIAVDGNCGVDRPEYDGYGIGTDISYYCDTAGGSSGSPVLSRTTNRVLALHHFGGCPNSGVRMDLIQQRIGALL